MTIFAVGISHHNATIDIREQFAFQEQELPQALTAICELPGIQEAVIINTCNRVEIYAGGHNIDPTQATEQLLDWLHQWHQLNHSHADCFQRYPGLQAVNQLMRVSAGLESLVLGEPQIGGQVKRAHALSADICIAGERAVLGTVLDRLFQQAFACAKAIRTETKLGQQPVTVPFAVLNLARQIFSDLQTCRVLLLGAGEMIELCAQHFSSHPVQQLLIVNRSIAGAQRLAANIQQSDNSRAIKVDALSLEQLSEHLHLADIVITSTASQQALIDQTMVKQALKMRRQQPMLMVDIAVPRDIDPKVRQLRDVYLYSIDDLTTVLDSNRRQRAVAALEAEQIINHEVKVFDQWLNLRQASSMLQHLRQNADQHTQHTLAQARQQLAKGQPVDAVIEQLAKQLTSRLLHIPTTKLRQAIMQGDIEQARRLQDLFTNDDQHSEPDKQEPERTTSDSDNNQADNQ